MLDKAGPARTCCGSGGSLPPARCVAHIPPQSSKAVNEEDGTFRSADELIQVYELAGITGEKPIITYCRIGERSSHSWFVLTHLLGLENVKNYDGSWTEWGKLVGAPIETGP